MKETLYTIPLMDAFKEDDECPFCSIQRKLERDNLDYILGNASAYMQTDIRAITNKHGFCSRHYKQMFQYGNALGNAIMMQSYLRTVKKDLKKEMSHNDGSKSGLLERFTKKDPAQPSTSLGRFLSKTTKDCFICQKNKETFARYLDTFFLLLRSDSEFYDIFRKSKGFCLHHMQCLVEEAPNALGTAQRQNFFDILFPQMEQAMDRLDEELAWFIDKFDYQNKDADWKTSKDALQRCMQKLTTGYPADTPYQKNR